MANRFVIGRGTQIFIAPLQVGDDLEPATATLTIGATVEAKGNTTLDLAAAIPANKFIPKFTYLGFVAPTGKEVLVQLNADAEAGDTTLTVFGTPAEIAAASVASYPLRVANRTAADLTRQGNVTSSTTFDDDGWAQGLTTGLSGSLSLPGNWSQLDPAYKTLVYLFLNQLNCYAWLETTKPNSDYSKGTVYKGVFNVSNMPIGFPADGVVSGDIELTLTGPLVEVDPVPTV